MTLLGISFNYVEFNIFLNIYKNISLATWRRWKLRQK